MTSECPSSEQLQHLLDGRLGRGEEETVAAHVETCGHCQRLLEDFTAGRVTLSSRPIEGMLRGLGQRPVLASLSRTGLAAAAGASLDQTYVTGGEALDLTAALEPAELPSIIGYEVLSVLGRGGMGVVYKVRDIRLKRLAALKMLRTDQRRDEGPRFALEAESLARVQHPNIVQIFEVGSYKHRPYLVMEFVEGGSLAEALAGRPLPPRRAAELVRTLAGAIHCAHQHGVIHRDLKPANILLAPSGIRKPQSDTKTDGPVTGLGFRISDVTPKVADFGLAKHLDSDVSLTQTGVVAGTPCYMAPEQVQGDHCWAGVQTDIHALGVILFETLTGRLPFTGSTPLEVVKRVVEQEPAAPRLLQPGTPRDLETICLKCLRKDPAQRYESAEALGEDLQRYLEGRPILARPLGAAARTLRWARRNPAVAFLLVLVFLGLLVMAGGSYVFALRVSAEAEYARQEKERADKTAGDAESEAARARREEERADREAKKAAGEKEEALRQLQRGEALLYSLQITAAQQAWNEGEAGQARSLLASTSKGSRDWAFGYLDGLFNQRGQKTLRGMRRPVSGVAVSPDGRWIAAASWDRTVHVWDAATLQRRFVLRKHGVAASGVAFSPDDRWIATSGWDKLAILWDARTGREVRTFRGHTNMVLGVEFSPDGKSAVTAGRDHTIKLWETATGKELRTLHGHQDSVQSATFSPDGKWIASAGMDQTVRLWDAQSGQLHKTLLGQRAQIQCVAFSPDSRRLASCGSDRTIRICDVPTGKESLMLVGHTDGVYRAAFSRDGKRLVSASEDRTVRVWNAATGEPLALYRGHEQGVSAALFTPDGKRIVSGSSDGTVKVWDASSTQEALVLESFSEEVLFDPIRGTLVLASEGAVRDLASGKDQRLEGNPSLWRLAICPRGKRLAGIGTRKGFAVWDLETRRQLHTANPEPYVLRAAFSPNGERIVTSHLQGELRVWNADFGKELLRWQGHPGNAEGLAFSRDGASVLSAGEEGIIKVWDAETGKPVRAWQGHQGPVSALACHPDGQRIISAGHDRQIKVWDRRTGRELFTLTGHTDGVFGVAVSGDGKLLASVSLDRSVRVWDMASGQPLLKLRSQSGIAYSVCFSPDGKLLASAGGGQVRIWDARPAP